jgi:signal peptidase II
MLYAIVAVLVLIADQWLKYWVTANIALNTGSMELIPGVFKLVNIHNEGAAFSLLAGWRWIFVALAVVFAAAVITALVRNMVRGGFGRWTLVLTAAGAAGNCIDRVMNGYVVDMFVIEPVKFIQVFNIADLFITIGGILFCFYLIFGGREKEKPARKEHEGHKHAEKAEHEGHKHVGKAEPEEHAHKHVPEKARHTAPQAAPAVQPGEETTVFTFKDAPEEKAKPIPRAEPEPAPVQEAPAAAPAADKPSKDDMSFSLDDIMDEFK